MKRHFIVFYAVINPKNNATAFVSTTCGCAGFPSKTFLEKNIEDQINEMGAGTYATVINIQEVSEGDRNDWNN